jgi:hypothetical protein
LGTNEPYLPEVDNVYKDHRREPVALGDMVARVRKGLHVSFSLTLIRVPVPVKVVILA